MRGIYIAGIAAAVVAGLVTYTVADIEDTVPGVLTAEPVPTATPFPQAPGATGPAPLPNIADPVAGASNVDESALEAALAPLLTPESGLGPSVSLHVASPADGEEIFSHFGDKAAVPASLTKILTGYAALKTLGPQWQASTQVSYEAGTVTLHGGGDQLLSGGAPGDGARGYASLDTLAEQTADTLKEQHITSARLALNDGEFAGPGVAPGWEPSDVTGGYVGPVSSVSIDAGRIEDTPYSPRHEDPGLYTLGVFAERLRDHGITVAGQPTRVDATPRDDETEVIAEVKSAPLHEVVTYVLRTSDNTVAEGLARQVALARGAGTTFADSSTEVLAAIEDSGIDTSAATIADGSGLAEGSKVPASVFTSVLVEAASDENTKLRSLISGLPVAGVEGTLAQRFGNYPAAQGVTRAKTGTLSKVTALAGTIRDTDDRLMVFALLADDTPSTVAARDASDALVAALATCGC